MSIAAIVTRGYGSFGSVNEVVTRGYSVGAAAAVPTSNSGSGAGASGGGVAVQRVPFPATHPPQPEPWAGLPETRRHPAQLVVRARVEINSAPRRAQDRQHPTAATAGIGVEIETAPVFALQPEPWQVLEFAAPVALIGPLRLVNRALRRTVEDLSIIGMT